MGLIQISSTREKKILQESIEKRLLILGGYMKNNQCKMHQKKRVDVYQIESWLARIKETMSTNTIDPMKILY